MKTLLLCGALSALAACSSLKVAETVGEYPLDLYDYNAPNGEVERGQAVSVSGFAYRSGDIIESRTGLMLAGEQLAQDSVAIRIQPQDIASFRSDLEHMLNAAEGVYVRRPMAGYSLKVEAVKGQKFLTIRNMDEDYQLRMEDAQRLHQLVASLSQQNSASR